MKKVHNHHLFVRITRVDPDFSAIDFFQRAPSLSQLLILGFTRFKIKIREQL